MEDVNDVQITKSSNFKSISEIWIVRFIALLTILMAIINVTSAITPALKERVLFLQNLLPFEVRTGSRFTAVVAGFALLLLASGLWRRKRTSWVLTLVFLTISIVTHLMKGLDYEEASFALSLIILLLIFRNSYYAYTDRPSMKKGLIVVLGALLFTLIYGVVGFYFLDKHFSVNFGLSAAIRQTFTMFTSFYNPGLEPITTHGKYFALSIYVVGLTTIGYSLLMLIRPVLVREPATYSERVKAAEIVNKYGKTSLARAALFDDKSYFFTGGGSVIAFCARGRGAMALGDPIGPEEDFKPAIIAFKAYCQRNDWMPSFASVLPDHLDDYKSVDLDAINIGNEAIIVLESFTLEGSDNKNVRNEFNRLIKQGYKTTVHMPPINDALLHDLHQISDAWLTMQHGGEMHFADGWFTDDYIRSCPVVVVHDPDGHPTAFANLVTEYTKNEITIDLMRRYPKVERGTMEVLFVTMLEWAREQGYETFSLGLSAVVGVGENPEDPQVEKALHTLAEYVSKFYNFKGLHTFKEKFHPRWEPRYIVYPRATSLPLVLSTLLRVHSGNNFLWKYLKKQ